MTTRYDKAVQEKLNVTKTFTLWRKSGTEIIQVERGIIVSAGIEGRPEWHKLAAGSPNWNKVSELLLDFYCCDNSKYKEIIGMLDKGSEEYEPLKESVKGFFELEIAKREESIKEFKSALAGLEPAT